MKHKTAELEGALLAAAVAKAEGLEVVSMHAEQDPEFAYCMVRCGNDETPEKYAPQRHAAQGLAIIERECMWIEPVFFEDFVEVAPFTVDYWEATDSRTARRGQGATPLIAAMRAYVASRFGEEVEL